MSGWLSSAVICLIATTTMAEASATCVWADILYGLICRHPFIPLRSRRRLARHAYCTIDCELDNVNTARYIIGFFYYFSISKHPFL